MASSGTRIAPLLVALGFVASAGTIATLVLTLRASPTWQVLPSSSGGVVVVDGIEQSALDRARLGDVLQTAKSLDSRREALSLQLRETLLCEMAAGTRLANMKLPPKGEQSLRLESGSLHVAIGAGYDGLVRVLTDEAQVDARHGAFAVSKEAGGTRVSALADGVSVGRSAMARAVGGDAALRALSAGESAWLAAGAEPEFGALREQDARILRQLATSAAERWNRGE
jgi:hypothetical protein